MPMSIGDVVSGSAPSWGAELLSWGNVALDAVDIYLKYMYTGNLDAGDLSRVVGTSTYLAGVFFYDSGNGSGAQPENFGLYLYNFQYTGDIIEPMINVAMGGGFAFSHSPAVNGEPTESVPTARLSSYTSRETSGGVMGFAPGYNMTFTVTAPTGNKFSQKDVIFSFYEFPLITNTHLGGSQWTKIAGTGAEIGRGIITNDASVTQQIVGTSKLIKIPFEEGKQYTYPEARDLLLQFCLDYPDLDLTIDDFPTFEQLQDSTEPTETFLPSGCCDIDYGEIMSPSEFYDILTTQEYDLEELNTDLPDLPVSLPDATFPTEYLTLTTESLTASWDLYDYLGLTNVFLPLAIVVALIKAIRGD